MTGRVLLLSFFIACFGYNLRAQSFFYPEIMINGKGLADQTQRELSQLQEQLTYMMVNYAPNVAVSYVPKQPIRIHVFVYVDEALGNRYKGSLEVALYRPMYGREQTSLLAVFYESDITFAFQSDRTATFIGQSIPDDIISRMVYYYATLGAMYYYDSFALYGGNPFIKYLKEQKRFFETAWDDQPLINNSQLSRLSTANHIKELETDYGDRFRELWYLYHREALDSEMPSSYGRVTYVVLDGLLQLKEYDSSLSFFQFFSDSKGMELYQYIEGNVSSNAIEVRRVAEELFPSIVFDR